MDESILLDLLECPVCLERLDASAKVLPCQHTFCRRCLQGILGSRGELRCPECRTLVECGVDELPSNILLVRLLDGIKQRPRMSASVGGACTNGTSGAVARAHGSGMRDQGNPGVQPQRTQAKSTAVRCVEAARERDFQQFGNIGNLLELSELCMRDCYNVNASDCPLSPHAHLGGVNAASH
ncbi:hypothetical protein AMECASPLE_025312 [Ameca splendens]|uniref:RING-type domain-containing protein n=1 Tax=Ameca splendens TaxID=208324 RepID=A0ABV0Y4I1_9TELE